MMKIFPCYLPARRASVTRVVNATLLHRPWDQHHRQLSSSFNRSKIESVSKTAFSKHSSVTHFVRPASSQASPCTGHSHLGQPKARCSPCNQMNGNLNLTGGVFMKFRTIRGNLGISQRTLSQFARSVAGGPTERLLTPVFLRIQDFPERTALLDQHDAFTYGDLLYSANDLADRMIEIQGKSSVDVGGARIAMLCPNDASYVVTQLATWLAGGISLPLALSHPPSELAYFIEDSGASLVVATEETAQRLQEAMLLMSSNQPQLLVLSKEDYLKKDDDLGFDLAESPSVNQQRLDRHNRQQQLLKENRYWQQPALILYTSGTTGRPKGVLHTHGNLTASVLSISKSWGFSSSDVLLHVLPLHHMHGAVVALLMPLYTGAACVMLPKFDADKVWAHLLGPAPASLGRPINVFMAVPTIYSKLVSRFEQRYDRGRGTRRVKDFVRVTCLSKFRLMVSGSAALPRVVMDRWEEITGHRLLERYGMTEIGMALTNPLKGHRIPGAVGKPFPGVEVCIAKPNVYSPVGYDVIASGNHRSTKVTPGCQGETGELFVRGLTMFKEYWQRPEATAEAFTKDGWFKTGDTVSFEEDGVYRILGRTSVDIIKSGGYKLSALEIERHILEHPDVTDVAVVGLPDVTWGQRVAAVVVLRDDASLTLDELRQWGSNKMPSYKMPTVLRILPSMPRNAMGKINKKDLGKQVFPKETGKPV